MGKLKIIIPFMLAVLIALLATFMIYNWMKRKATSPILSKIVPRSQVVLANEDLAWGTRLTPQMLKTAPITRGDVPKGSFSKADQVAGRVLITPVEKNEPIMEYKLASKNVTQGGVSAIVAPGMRAIAVAGDKVMGLAGFIHPGNHVDILVTVTDPQNRETRYTKTVLENIKVLATGTVLKSQGNGTKPEPVDVFTVEVTPDQAEQIALAASQGKLSFALRNATDKTPVLTMGATLAGLLDSYRPPIERVSEPAAHSAPKIEPMAGRRFEMQVINGTKINQVSFGQ